MIAIPAVDLREGACVQLVGGSYDDERIRLEDPAAVAGRWVSCGFRRLHLVDLDAATGRGSNRALIRSLIASAGVPVQVGGGVRSADDIRDLLDAGAAAVVIGTRGVEDPGWLRELAGTFPKRLMLAADVRGRRVVTAGWTRELEVGPLALLQDLRDASLAGVLVTAVHREGRLAGTDLPLMTEVVTATELPVHGSGGITTMEDLRGLAGAGCAGAVLGMALYTEALDPRAVAEEFGA